MKELYLNYNVYCNCEIDKGVVNFKVLLIHVRSHVLCRSSTRGTLSRQSRTLDISLNAGKYILLDSGEKNPAILTI